MEQIKVSDLASEFEIHNSHVISELKKIGVWVPSSNTPLDQDIAKRIRRRLQLQVEQEIESKIRDAKTKGKKSPAQPKKATKKTIRQLGKARRRPAKATDDDAIFLSPLTSTLKPRKGRSKYRGITEIEEVSIPDRIEVSIDDEPLIQKIEASLSEEILEKALLSQAVEKELLAQETAVTSESPSSPIPEKEDKTAEHIAVSSPEETELRAQEVAPPTSETGPHIEIPRSKHVSHEETDRKSLPTDVTIPENVSVRELSERIGIKSKDILKQLIDMGVMAANINQSLDQKTAEDLCLAFEIVPHFVSFEEAIIGSDAQKETPEDLVIRAPVVTVMGHVDHGKTSLLDAIRKTQVAASEAGGITQHIGAYHANVEGKRIVFIDTPGHAAFTMMRSRGAQITDIVVLVVAADDGVMPQTKEAIDHARAADVPIIVAINKIDRPNANVQRTKQQLSDHQLIAEDWGGDTIMVEVSATEKTNLDLLLETILLVADITELKANPKLPASGVVLEARLDKGRGVVATVLVQNGSLEASDLFIAGTAMGRVRAMFDDRGKSIVKVGPSSAVEILGLQSVPLAGDTIQAIDDSVKARQIINYRMEKEKEKIQAQDSKVSLEDLYGQMQSGEVKELAVVIKADTQGSVEVVCNTLAKLGTEKVSIKVIHSNVGAVSETDVVLASASEGIIIGFNVRPEPKARTKAEKEGIDIRLHTVIYELTEEVSQAMTGLLDPTFKEVVLGQAEVREIFRVPKFGTIAGSYIRDGSIKRNAEMRLLRDNVVIHEGKIDSLRRFKEDVREVKNGYECGISIADFNDIKPGDVFEAFTKEESQPEVT